MENHQKLYLLEFMVNTVHYDKPPENGDHRNEVLGQTVVTVKFLHFPPMNVMEENFVEIGEPYEDTDVVMKAGKSILFPITGIGKVHPCCEVKVIVSRKRLGPFPTDVVIGKASVPLNPSTINLLNLPPQIGAGSKSISGTYGLKNSNNETVGNISIFLRLSCFGNLIVTKFLLEDMDKEQNMYFRGGSDMGKQICDNLFTGVTNNGMAGFGEQENVSPQHYGDYVPEMNCNKQITPACPYQMSLENISRQPVSNNHGPSQKQPYPFCQRVTIGEPLSCSSSESSLAHAPAAPALPFNVCECDYPLPEGLMCPPCPQKKPKKKKEKHSCPLEPQAGDYCLRSDCPCGLSMPPWLMDTGHDKPTALTDNIDLGQGAMAFKDKQAIYPFPDGRNHQDNTIDNFSGAAKYRVGLSSNEKGKRNVLQVIPDAIDAQPDLLPDKDVFVLHIGKPTPYQKAKMEIQLLSPKYKQKQVQLCDSETQYMEADVMAAKKKKSKGDEGPKAKGKKGKKGKGK